MRTAQVGDRVRAQYSRLAADAATARRTKPETCEFMVGSRDVFPTLSLSVVGMAEGDRKQLSLQPAEAYGPVNSKLIREISRARFPKHLILHVGKRLTAIQKLARRRRRVTVVEISADSVTVDGNHPLAGKVIELEVRLLAILASANGKPSQRRFDLGNKQ